MLMKISKTDTRDAPASRRHAHTAKQCEPMPNAINCGRYVNVAHVRHTFGVGVFLTRPISVVGVRARPPEEKSLYTRAVCARWAFFGVYFARDWEICVRTPNASFTPTAYLVTRGFCARASCRPSIAACVHRPRIVATHNIVAGSRHGHV